MTLRRALSLGLGALLLAGAVACTMATPPGPTYPEITGPRTKDADVFARGYLDQMQARSFAENREFCGLFGRDAEGYVVATPPRRGHMDSCAPAWGPRGFAAFASYHSHGAFDFEADSEIPSPSDLIADIQDGLIGYVSTPGGRLWRNEGHETQQICGRGCLTPDPAFIPVMYGVVAQSYTLSELQQRVSQHGGW